MFVLVAAVLLAAADAGRFGCKDFEVPPAPANDITRLHPGHVGYVMAMGDSITAGFAARSTPLEARDISWSIGVGSSEQLTMPYMISRYRSNVSGMSTKAVVPHDIFNLPKGDYHPSTDRLNVAESSGAVHLGSMEEQWGYLSKAVADKSAYPGFDDAWKVLTVWMTANDVCGAGHECQHAMKDHDIQRWVDGTEAMLTNVSKTMRKVYVNLVSTLDLSQVHRIQQESGEFCKFEHKVILRECGCIDRGNPQELKQLDENVHTLNNELHKLAAKWYKKLQDEGRTDMAVTVQGFQEGVGKQLDKEFLNALDCFHPSSKGHETLAIGLWNSMLCANDRQGDCGKPFMPDLVPTCPTVNSTLYVGPDQFAN